MYRTTIVLLGLDFVFTYSDTFTRWLKLYYIFCIQSMDTLCLLHAVCCATAQLISCSCGGVHHFDEL